MKNIILTAFCGTSSEKLVKNTKFKSLILPNDKIADSKLLLNEITRQKYDIIFSFGQKPNIKNKIFIETTAKNNDKFVHTNLEYSKLKNIFETCDISVKISYNAGTSFCNMLYWNVLNYIYNQLLDTQMIFIHIPFYKNISDSELFFNEIIYAIENYIKI